MNVLEQLGIDVGYVVLGALGFSLFLFLLVIVLFVKISKLNKKYAAFMEGADGKSLEDAVQTRFQEVDTIKEIIKKQQLRLEKTDEVLKTSYQKVGIVKYDAFKEMGGKLSFAVALLNQENSGFIINSMHSTREGCYTYIKEIIRGESFVVLAAEEKEALNQAITCHDLIKETNKSK